MDEVALLQVYDLAIEDEYRARDSVRFAVVPRVHGLRKVAEAVARDERRTVIGTARSIIRDLDTEPDGLIRAADALELLEQLGKETT